MTVKIIVEHRGHAAGILEHPLAQSIVGIICNGAAVLLNLSQPVVLVVDKGSGINAGSTVRIRAEGKEMRASAEGDGPIDASFKAIDRITGLDMILIDYNLEAVSEGKDAIGQVKIIVSADENEVMGSGISTDIVEASIKAYIDAANRLKAII